MIICHSRKFVYVKNLKVAGSSVHYALEHHLQPQDISIRIVHDGVPLPKNHNFFHVTGFAHVSYRWLTELLPSDKYCNLDQYFKFCVVRNPWDRMVSWFWHNQQHRTRLHTAPMPQVRKAFSHWLLKTLADDGGLPDFDRYSIDGKSAMDFHIRFENLQHDYEQVCRRLGVHPVPLPHCHSQFRKNPEHYSRYYDDATAQLVEHFFPDDIRNSGYIFGR